MANPIISLSTSYLQPRFKNDGYAMLQAAAELGFEYVELGHSTSQQSCEGILKAVSEGVVKVSSLHNFCPSPPFASGPTPNLYSPATKSKIESGQWLRHTRESLEFAHKTGAKVLVCHVGSLSYFFRRPDAKLKSMISGNGSYEGLEDNLPYLDARDTFMARAKKRSEARDYLNIVKNLGEVDALARENGVDLAVENRDSPSELPLDWNFEKLIGLAKEKGLAQVCSWHDTGHSMRKQLALLCRQTELIERLLGSLRGWHLHDCSKEGKDHIAIGKGCIDFQSIARFFDKRKHIFTIELNRSVRTRDAADSLKRVQDLLA